MVAKNSDLARLAASAAVLACLEVDHAVLEELLQVLERGAGGKRKIGRHQFGRCVRLYTIGHKRQRIGISLRTLQSAISIRPVLRGVRDRGCSVILLRPDLY
jgi:hypothetical protein